ncbi:AMIN domain-containing protein [Nostoc sp.]|uniref:AMIN domain-containing protein n=1 Tax=Nostoc sp. TaxID=1180 RepID=UPI003594947D
MKSQLLPSFLLAGAVILISQPVFAQAIQITGVKLNPTQNGIEVILETSAGEQLQVLPRIDGNNYIADIPNTQLLLQGSNAFRQDNPTEGITLVTVTNATKGIRVTVTGSKVVPTVEIFDSDDGLIFSFTPAVSSTQSQQPPQKPPDTPQPGSETQQETTQLGDETPATPEVIERGSETQQGETSADENELIEIVVTGEQEDNNYFVPDATSATRTDTPILDTPQSVQTIPPGIIHSRSKNSLSMSWARNRSALVRES